jgi:hypothetical protein
VNGRRANADTGLAADTTPMKRRCRSRRRYAADGADIHLAADTTQMTPIPAAADTTSMNADTSLAADTTPMTQITFVSRMKRR